ncbi:MAG: phospho-sugar mutase [Lachnospiraceae bacterium]|jgi:phosphoglucomutase|nr:phospho-sugar mutase [Lachnospiraceae bacterium]
MEDYKRKYEEWLNNPFFDEATRAELLAISGDEKEIEDRFYKDLEFGTAGLRGVIGAGTNRMNFYIIRKATGGLANYINKQHKAAPAVAIAYDSRHMSPEFAKEAALVLAGNGIKAYLFESLRPTPQLSFAVRELKCIAGINITASHNPPAYNGYKVYWEDGAQITPPHDIGIMDEVRAVTDYSAVKILDEESAISEGLLEIIGKDIDDLYINTLKEQVLHPEAIAEMAKDIKIVYTPLHGTGNVPVRRVLKELGFENVFVVPKQEKPDGDFPTVSYPNPETAEAFTLGLKLAKEVDADLILATDPDADRLGVYVKDGMGEYHVLTGNMSGCLLADYEIAQRKAVKGLPEDGYLVKTIVTSNLARAIADYYKIECKEVLTGFKYIGQQILLSEQTGKGTYLFGFEESYGCLIGTYARDKDAVSASMALCEAAAYYKLPKGHSNGMTLWEAMCNIYNTLGWYLEDVYSITLEGIEGAKQMQKLMEAFKVNPPLAFGVDKVLRIRDYKKGEISDCETQAVSPTGLPKSDVLYYDLDDDGWVCVRPSGTEPKVKVYFGVRGNSAAEAKEKSAAIKAAVLKEVDGILKD